MSNCHCDECTCGQRDEPTYEELEQQLAEANKKMVQWQALVSRKGLEPELCDGYVELVEFLAKAKEEGRAETQARIKALEDALRLLMDWQVKNVHVWHNSAFDYCTDILSTTSPTEALDKVVREAIDRAISAKRITVVKGQTIRTKDYGAVVFEGFDYYIGQRTVRLRGIEYPGYYFPFPHKLESEGFDFIE